MTGKTGITANTAANDGLDRRTRADAPAALTMLADAEDDPDLRAHLIEGLRSFLLVD